MKKLNLLLISILALVIISCSGSDAYRGSWKAMNAEGGKFVISFDEKNFSVKDSTGQIKNYGYSQHSFQISNSIKTYGIQLDDGRNYQIHFPKANNDSLGLIRDDSGNPIYSISRQNYVRYQDIYKLE